VTPNTGEHFCRWVNGIVALRIAVCFSTGRPNCERIVGCSVSSGSDVSDL
jgi:hypothetical protein